MKTLLSVPPNLAQISKNKKISLQYFNDAFVTSDPDGKRVGSGGGTAWLLTECMKAVVSTADNGTGDFASFLKAEKRILIHAGGQSRRLPAYSTSGKILTPIPVYRWKTGQKIDQSLLDIQTELYRKLMERSKPDQNTLIASGDVLLRCPNLPEQLPEADVVCIASWIDASVATHHGVFLAKKETPETLDFMLQKPSSSELEQLLSTHVFMLDTGCWILSDRAVQVLMKKCGWNRTEYTGGIPRNYDFYTSFGASLGTNPKIPDETISAFTCALVNPDGAEFYHYGTTRELVSSTEKIQNLVTDPRGILLKRVKAHPSLFVQNADVHVDWKSDMRSIWIENSCVPVTWHLQRDTVITGVPENSWEITIPAGVCVDVVPIGNGKYCLRPYGTDDAFRGPADSNTTLWMGKPLTEWFWSHGVMTEPLIRDIQQTELFPIVKWDGQDGSMIHRLLNWMINVPKDRESENTYRSLEKLSADELLARADVPDLFEQRRRYQKGNLAQLASNYEKSVFYQCDLSHTAELYRGFDLPVPETVSENTGFVTRMRSSMLRSYLLNTEGNNGTLDEKNAFLTLREAVVSAVEKVQPEYTVQSDQIVWGRSPVRIDLAGGWSDTPPYSICSGGSVVTIAIDLNGQQPVQIYIRPVRECSFTLRSIDTGVSEIVTEYSQLSSYSTVGSSFSIPKAALCLAGFSPEFSVKTYDTLEQQLKGMGGGLEITLLAAIPKGSGLGTSSVLAAALLGSLSDVCALGWSREEICFRTLALEQLLTSGGGWQDQYGAVYGGVNLLESQTGIQNSVQVRRLPRDIFTDTSTAGLWILYYTGITRVAKNILGDIVRGMFLNKGPVLDILDDIKQHSLTTADAIQFGNYRKTAELVKRSWNLNKQLDPDTTSSQINAIVSRIDDYAAGYKLPGAGGGGYLLICAKDIDAVPRIRQTLETNPPNPRARFVRMTLNTQGLQISRS